MNNTIVVRLEKLREVLRIKKMDAWVALTSDPHLSEYIPDYWKTREYLSGFTGSAGTLIVTDTKAGLWTDSRYWQQAEQQLSGTSIELFKLTKQSVGIWEWLFQELSMGQSIGIDGNTLAYDDYLELEKRAKEFGLMLKLDEDIINLVWSDRPTLPKNKLYEHAQKFNSLTCQQKIEIVREQMHTHAVDYHLVSSLDDIAWLTNLRGSDVDYNPIFLAHLLISLNETILFIDSHKVTDSIQDYLHVQGIIVQAYENVAQYISKLTGTKLLVDTRKVTYGVLGRKQNSTQLKAQVNPSTFLKSRKTPFELAHIKDAMLQDGIALCQFFCWLDKTIQAKKVISELDVDEELSVRRTKQNNFISLSFNTIAGFGPNSALPHYSATQESFSMIEGNGVLLIDSGGQYTNGTTDITRVVAINQVTSEQKRDFTLVLKSHIAMACLVYPEGIKMPLLDVMARAPLWQEHLDFGHGTGHGVGYFLNVHEGPQVLSCYSDASEKTRVYSGMVTSIEPGLYRPGQWGIRIENLVASIAHHRAEKSDYGNFLCFDTLTLCPIDQRLIEAQLLTEQEKSWLNAYHAIVKDHLIQYLTPEEQVWLEWTTQAIN